MDPMDLRRVVESARDAEVPFDELESFLASEDDAWTFWRSVGRAARARYNDRLASETSRKFGAGSRSVWEAALTRAIDAEVTPFEIRSLLKAAKDGEDFALELNVRALEKDDAW